jgi:hypothetical protein
MVLQSTPSMEDFNGLASSLATGVSDVRGCLLLSRDGLVLGSHPQDGEAQVKTAWMRFAALGDPERGFTQFGTETWCYVRRGPYAAFAVVGLGERPGLVIDHMEQILLAAEEARNSREGVRAEAPAPAPALPTSKPRTPLHPEPRPLEEPLVVTADAAEPRLAETVPWEAGVDEPPMSVGAAGEQPPASERPAFEPDETGLDPTPAAPSRLDNVWGEGQEPEGDVDRFSLAREFGRLLQDGEDGADG